MIDPLERRCLLSSSLNPTTGILFVDGTAGDDVITFEKVTTSKGERLNVTINSVAEGFKLTKIKGISVSAGDGNDSVTIGSIGLKTTVDGGAGDDALLGGNLRDKLIGDGGNNSLSGAGGPDILTAGTGSDSINGGGGNDVIIPDNQLGVNDKLIGGAGNDTIDYANSTIAVSLVIGVNPKATSVNDFIPTDIETVIGSGFNDRITDESTLPESISGGGGNDRLNGSGNGDTLDGGAGNDTLVSGAGGAVSNRPATNLLLGGSGKDLLIAGPQKDSLSGGSGNDRLVADSTSPSNDNISGGSGTDSVDFSGSTVGVTVAVGGSSGNAAGVASDVELVIGSDFADTISDSTSHPLEIEGGGGDDVLTGGSGDDTLVGGGGHDSISGSDGNDLIKAKDGKSDTIDGGAGTDTVTSDAFVGLDTVTNVP